MGPYILLRRTWRLRSGRGIRWWRPSTERRRSPLGLSASWLPERTAAAGRLAGNPARSLWHRKKSHQISKKKTAAASTRPKS